MISSYSMKAMEPGDLTNLLIEECLDDIPTGIDTIEDMVFAQRRLGEITNLYSYMMSCLAQFKIWVKVSKSQGQKEETDAMIMRRDSVEIITKVLDQQYAALSRMLTIKQEINNELKMTGGV